MDVLLLREHVDDVMFLPTQCLMAFVTENTALYTCQYFHSNEPECKCIEMIYFTFIYFTSTKVHMKSRIKYNVLLIYAFKVYEVSQELMVFGTHNSLPNAEFSHNFFPTLIQLIALFKLESFPQFSLQHHIAKGKATKGFINS